MIFVLEVCILYSQLGSHVQVGQASACEKVHSSTQTTTQAP